MDSRQKTASPDTFTGIRCFAPGGKYYETVQILVFGTQTIGDPGSYTWSAQSGTSGMHEQLGGPVVELIRIYCFQEGHFIHDLGKVR